MDATGKRRLAPIEVNYYCMLGGIDRDTVAEAWFDTKTSSVEIVLHGFIDRVTIDGSFRVPPQEKP